MWPFTRKTKLYVYHYCWFRQMGNGSLEITDGIAKMENKITSHEEYLQLKDKAGLEHHQKLTLVSLSFIGMESI